MAESIADSDLRKVPVEYVLELPNGALEERGFLYRQQITIQQTQTVTIQEDTPSFRIPEFDSNMIGSVGALLAAGAYTANVLGRWRSDSKRYLITNIIAAGALAYNVYDKGAWAPAALNLYMAAIPTYKLIKDTWQRGKS